MKNTSAAKLPVRTLKVHACILASTRGLHDDLASLAMQVINILSICYWLAYPIVDPCSCFDADMQMASAAYRCVPRLPTRICLVRALIPRGTYVSELEIDEQPNRDLVNLDARTVPLPPRPDNRYCESHCFAVKLDQSHNHAERRGCR